MSCEKYDWDLSTQGIFSLFHPPSITLAGCGRQEMMMVKQEG
jgi:hypothetical protein